MKKRLSVLALAVLISPLALATVNEAEEAKYEAIFNAEGAPPVAAITTITPPAVEKETSIEKLHILYTKFSNAFRDTYYSLMEVERKDADTPVDGVTAPVNTPTEPSPTARPSEVAIAAVDATALASVEIPLEK